MKCFIELTDKKGLHYFVNIAQIVTVYENHPSLGPSIAMADGKLISGIAETYDEVKDLIWGCCS